jgi:tetratricopeptide (TPR) repeat protein
VSKPQSGSIGGQSVSGSLIVGDNIQIGYAGGDVVILQDRPAYRLELLGPAALRQVVPRWRQQPSYLLDAQRQVVPFHGRASELADLAAWRDDTDTRLSVRLVHGRGGQGKTRLASRFASHSFASKWSVAQATDMAQRRGGAGVATALANVDHSLLVVIDYAERWRLSTLVQLVEDLELDYPDRLIRVLLLARPGEELWENVRSELGRSSADLAEPLPLDALAKRVNDRAAAFGEAAEAFSRALGLTIRPMPSLQELAHPDYGNALTLHMAALAAVCAHRDSVAVPGRQELSTYLIEHERRGWRRAAASSTADGLHGVAADRIERAVFVATLLGPLKWDASLAALSRAHIADGNSAAEQILAMHQALYPDADGQRPATDVGPVDNDSALVPLRPDRFAEDFLGEALRRGWGRAALYAALDNVIYADASAMQVIRRGLTVLAATGQRHQHVAEELFALLRARPGLIKHSSPELVRLVIDAGPAELLVLVEGFLRAFNIELLRPARDLAIHCLLSLDDSAPPRQRAYWLTRAGVRLADAGDRRAALQARREATGIYRQLFQAEPAAYLPKLANSLNNLGASLSEVGDHHAALEATREATAIYRRLAAAKPANHLTGLARALNNLAIQLSEVGDRRAALEAAREAVQIHRRLAEAEPIAHMPELAGQLNNLGVHLSELGDRRAALEATREAVQIHRRLAEAEPTAHLPELSMALHNLAIRLSEVGDRRAALEATREATAIYRRLAEAEPAAYLPELANSLNNLGVSLSEVGDHHAALEATREATAIYRRLAEAEPAAHLPSL